MLSSVINKVFSQQEDDWREVSSEGTALDIVIDAKEKLTKIDFQRRDLNTNIQLVLSIDTATFPKVGTVTHQYLTALRDNDTIRGSVEEGMFDYLRSLYSRYTTILDQTLHQKKIVLSASEVSLILARYLNALFAMSKWRYFDDQPAPAGAWHNVHKVIRYAEKLDILNKNLFLYEFQKRETSIASLLKRGFMIDTLQQGSFSAMQIELADRVLNTWSTNPNITKDFVEGEYQFFIHLDGDNRPQRLRGAKAHPNFRYWKTARLVGLIENYLCAVDTKQHLELLKTKGSTKHIVELFKKLRTEWCLEGYKRQRRNEERSKHLYKLQVSQGVEAICARIKRAESNPTRSFKPRAKTVDDVLDIAIEGVEMTSFDVKDNSSFGTRWTVSEESSTGFSVALGTEISGWVKSGALIGYAKDSDRNHIAIAEIKNVRKKTDGTYRIGLLNVANHAMVVSASLMQTGTIYTAGDGYEVHDRDGSLSYSEDFASLLIDQGEGEKSLLIVPRLMYKAAHQYRITVNGNQQAVLAGDAIHKHRGWVGFEIDM